MGNGVSRKGAVIVRCEFRCAFGDVAMPRGDDDRQSRKETSLEAEPR